MILPEMPDRIAKLPKDDRGYPVPWFVAYIDGKPDFRVIAPGKVEQAVIHTKCWICGEKVGQFVAFVIGPMCAVNRISAEPPSHRDCAEFAAKACPFLTRPKMKRNEKDIPEESQAPAGVMIKRNPGVSLVWITRQYTAFPVDNSLLFQVGPPEETLWFAEGRRATRSEVEASIKSGLPLLMEQAEKDGPDAKKLLAEMYEEALKLLPPQLIIH